MPRTTKLLNKDIYNTIIDYISNGNYIKTACLAAGISERVFYNWVERAERSNGNGDDIYVQFLQDLKIAEAENIAHNVKNVQDAADNDHRNWMASAWILERKYPSEFGKRMELEVGPSKVLLALQERMASLREVKQIEAGDE